MWSRKKMPSCREAHRCFHLRETWVVGFNGIVPLAIHRSPLWSSVCATSRCYGHSKLQPEASPLHDRKWANHTDTGIHSRWHVPLISGAAQEGTRLLLLSVCSVFPHHTPISASLAGTKLTLRAREMAQWVIADTVQTRGPEFKSPATTQNIRQNCVCL